MQQLFGILLSLGLAASILAWYRYWARWVSWDLADWDQESPSDWREANVAADLRALFALERRRQHVLFGYQLWLKCLHTSSIVQLVVTGSVSGIVIELVLDAVERAGSWRGMSAEALLGLVLLVAPVVAGTVHFVTALRHTGQRFKAAVRRLDGEIAEQRRRVAEA